MAVEDAASVLSPAPVVSSFTTQPHQMAIETSPPVTQTDVLTDDMFVENGDRLKGALESISSAFVTPHPPLRTTTETPVSLDTISPLYPVDILSEPVTQDDEATVGTKRKVHFSTPEAVVVNISDAEYVSYESSSEEEVVDDFFKKLLNIDIRFDDMSSEDTESPLEYSYDEDLDSENALSELKLRAEIEPCVLPSHTDTVPDALIEALSPSVELEAYTASALAMNAPVCISTLDLSDVDSDLDAEMIVHSDSDLDAEMVVHDDVESDLDKEFVVHDDDVIDDVGVMGSSGISIVIDDVDDTAVDVDREATDLCLKQGMFLFSDSYQKACECSYIV